MSTCRKKINLDNLLDQSMTGFPMPILNQRIG